MVILHNKSDQIQDMKNLFFLFVLSCIPIFSFSQNQPKIDSLKNLLKTNLSDEKRVDVWNDLAFEFKKNDSSSVAEYTQKAISLAKKINYIEGEIEAYDHIGWATMMGGDYGKAIQLFEKSYKLAKMNDLKLDEAIALNSLGVVHWYQGDFESSLEYFEKCIEAYKAINSTKNLVTAYNNVGLVQVKLGKNEEARQFYFKSLEIQLELKADKDENMAMLYNNIGVTYVNQSNYKKGIEYYLMALRIQEKLDNKHGMALNLNNIGVIHNHQKNYKKAIQYFNQSLKINQKISHKKGLTMNYENLSDAYVGLNDLEKAINLLSEALTITEKIGDKEGLVKNYISISNIYIKQQKFKNAYHFLEKSLRLSLELGTESLTTYSYLYLGIVYYHWEEFTKSKDYLNNAIQLARKLNQPESIQTGADYLSKVESSLGNYQAAYEAHLLFKELSDSLFNQEKSKQIASLEIQYETEKKEQQIATLSQEAQIKDLELNLKDSELNRYILIMTILGVSLIVLLFGGAIAYLINQQKQLKLQQQAQNMEQKMLRAQMNPHFIFNSMAVIQDFILQNHAEEAVLYLSQFSKLTRQVLENSRNDYIRLEQEISMLKSYLSLQNLRKQNPFTYEVEVSENLDAEEVAIPPMFAQPFIENAIEHGLDDSINRGEIKIKFDIKGDHVLLSIQDNGVGIQEATQIKKNKLEDHESLATKITEERINILRRSIKKNISFDIQSLAQGTQVIFRLPYKFV